MNNYKTSLQEPSRPPSRSGNTNAIHLHIITIDNEDYTFRALGTKQWAYKDDSISFQYEKKGEYKNIITDTLKTIDKNGASIVRGNRGTKNKSRTVTSRAPGSKKQNRD